MFKTGVSPFRSFCFIQDLPCQNPNCHELTGNEYLCIEISGTLSTPLLKSGFKIRRQRGRSYRVTPHRHFSMQLNNYPVADIIFAHRRAMMLYRKDYLPLGRNAIEVLLYATTKKHFTATEIATKLLYCNLPQAKNTIAVLKSHGLLWSAGEGIKGKPLYYFLSEKGGSAVLTFLNLF